MSRIKLIALAAVAAFCISAVAAAAATASEAELLNKEGNALVKNKFTATSGETIIEAASGTKITCKADTAHGVVTSVTGGEVTILFTECTSLGLPCTGGKDASGEAPSGSIYVLAGITVRAINSEEEALLSTIHAPGTSTAGELEVACSGVKIKLKGSFLTQPVLGNTLSKSLTLEAKETKGVQEETEYENAKGEKVKCEGLKASVSGGAFEAAGMRGNETVSFEEEAGTFPKIGPFRLYVVPRELRTGAVTGTVRVENDSAVEVEILGAELEAVAGKKFGFSITADNCKKVKLAPKAACIQSVKLTSEGAGEYRGLMRAKTATEENGVILRGRF